MKTNDLKKGQRVKLRNGWEAELADNARGQTRMAKVFGDFTETGSVYSHDIVWYEKHNKNKDRNEWHLVSHTPAQLKLKQRISALGL